MEKSMFTVLVVCLWCLKPVLHVGAVTGIVGRQSTRLLVEGDNVVYNFRYRFDEPITEPMSAGITLGFDLDLTATAADFITSEDTTVDVIIPVTGLLEGSFAVIVAQIFDDGLVEERETFTLICIEGGQTDRIGPYFIDDNDPDPCATNPCINNVNAECIRSTPTSSEFTCQCLPGYTEDGMMMCVDIDECAMDSDNCADNADCENTDGGFNCTCDEGYYGNGVNCTDIDECDMNSDDCGDNAECTNTGGSFNCTCDMGYTGDGVNCTDIDECEMDSDNCDDNADCENTDGGFKFMNEHLDMFWHSTAQQHEDFHGLIGQFFCKGVEIDEIRKILIMPNKEPVPVMRRPVWAFMEREQKDDQLCWTAMNPGYQGQGLIDGKYSDYAVKDVLAEKFVFGEL